MKLKFKPTNRQLAVAGIVVVAAFGLLAHQSADDQQPQASAPLDAAARQACDDFDAGYLDAKTKPARLALADKVMTSTRRSDNKAIADQATNLGLTAGDGGPAWRRNATDFTTTCENAGWRAP